MPQFTDLSRVARVALAADPFIKGLQPAQAMFRVAWSTKDAGGTTQISYSFPWADGAASKFTAPYGKGENTAATTGAVTGPQAAQIAKAFDAWSNVANIAFTPIAETAGGEVGDIRVAFTSAIGPDKVWWRNPATGGNEYLIKTPMVYDILAIQKFYGANMAYRTGDDTYAFDPAAPSFEAIWDAGGTDTFSVAAFSGGCTVDLKPGAYSSLAYNTVSLSQNIGIAFGCTIENALGGAGGDTLLGSEIANLLDGGAGADTLRGAGGNDTLIGGAGQDLLDGGAGRDMLQGGDGGDTFRFAVPADLPGTAANTADVIMDFSRAQGDRIDLSGIDAIKQTSAVNEAFTWIGSAAFGKHAGELRYVVTAGVGLVSGDIDGNGTADFAIRIDGGPALIAGDFFL